MTRPTRGQLEIGLLVLGTLAILLMYRSYLERSLAIQERATEPDQPAPPAAAPPAPGVNGHVPGYPTPAPPVEGGQGA